MSLLKKKLDKKNKKNKDKIEVNDGLVKKTGFLSQAQLNKRNNEIFLEENKLPLLKLDNICFSVFNKKDFFRKSITNIDNPNRNLDPLYSLEDPRLGTIDHRQLCGLCDKTTEECIGHFGRIELGFNFIHPLYRPIVIMVLQCICHCCNKLLLKGPVIAEKNLLLKRGFVRLKEFVEESKNETCMNPKCGAKVIFKSTKKSNSLDNRSIAYHVKKGNEEGPEKFISVDIILTRLKAIDKKDLETLGFKHVHPKDFIMDYIPIIPLTDRPPGITETEKKDHALTYAYNDILNIFLESKHLLSEDDQDKCYIQIIKIYLALIINKKEDENTYTRNQQEPLEAIKDMINSKEGIIRNNLLAKRSDYSGRTVLGPNNRLNFGYIALSEEMTAITVPEIITHYNYKRIQRLVSENKVKFLCPKKGNLAGRKMKFNYEMHKDKMFIGDRIERMIDEGDFLVFNRTPTLQPQSMLGYKIVVQDKKSIGIHLSSTQGLNADFDGDEGQIHIIQTPEARTETSMLMNVESNIMSYSNSTPESALVYNSLVSGFLMSKEELIFTQVEFNNALDYVNERMMNDYVKNNYKTLKERLGDINPLSGKALISILFPSDFWYQHISDDNQVLIGKGVLRKGRLKKEHLGSSNFSIICSIYKEHGNMVASYFISAANFLFNWYIYRTGFTLSFKDITLREHAEKFAEKREEIINESNQILQRLNKKEPYTLSEIEEKDNEISKIFDNTAKKIDKEVSDILDYDNSIFVMINSGAKGTISKATEIVGSKGVISINKKLPDKNMTDNKRWLTTFSVEDYRLESRGFSKNSYYEGLDEDAYFAECQSGRMGIIDTAVKTSDIGYMLRKMVKSNEDEIINYDGSIRNQRDVIFQFSYGPNFKTNEMVIDNSEDNSSIFSFINIKNLVGKINYNNGFGLDIFSEIKGIARKINSKYNYIDNTGLGEDEDEDDEDEKLYSDEDNDGED